MFAVEFFATLLLSVAGAWVLLSPLPSARLHLVPVRIQDAAPRFLPRPRRRGTSRGSADSPDH